MYKFQFLLLKIMKKINIIIFRIYIFFMFAHLASYETWS